MSDVHSMWPLIFVREGYVEKVNQMNDTERWNEYLLNLSSEPVSLSAEHAEAVRGMWAKLLQLAGCKLRSPRAIPYGEAGFHMAWVEKGGFYLNIDIRPDGKFEWFVVSDIDNSSAGPENDNLTEPPDELIRLLTEHCSVERKSDE